jgi:hypothetical protein
MGLMNGLVQQLLQQIDQPSSVSKPEYTNFYTKPGEKLNIDQGNNVDSGTFYVAPNKPLDIVSGTQFKSKGGVVRGMGIATRGAKKAKIY